MTLTLEQARQEVDELIYSVRGKRLDQNEEIVFQAAWENLTYKEVAANNNIDLLHLQNSVAQRFYQALSVALGTKVGKLSLRTILEQRGVEHSVPATEEKFSSSTSIVLAETSIPSPCTGFVLGGQPPNISQFVGYVEELTRLRQLTFENQCVALIGQGGVGKSSLVAKLLHMISADPCAEFNYLIWKSLQFKPPFTELADELLKLLLNQLEQEIAIPEQAPAKVSLLIEILQSHRCLIVLDGSEAIQQGDRLSISNSYGAYQEYGEFINRVVEEKHLSCLLLTSQEPFSNLTRHQNLQRPVGILKLTGLGAEAKKILSAKGLTGEEVWDDLIRIYRGNPFGLKLAASYIKEFFAGDVRRLIEEKSVLIFMETLEQQFSRLSQLEEQLLVYLACQMEDGLEIILFPHILTEFRSKPSMKVSLSDLVHCLHLLSERSLVETGTDSAGERYYLLQPEVKKYTLTRLVVHPLPFAKAS